MLLIVSVRDIGLAVVVFFDAFNVVNIVEFFFASFVSRSNGVSQWLGPSNGEARTPRCWKSEEKIRKNLTHTYSTEIILIVVSML